MNRIIVPLDVPTATDAHAIVDAIGSQCDFYKVGLQLFTSEGPGVVESLKAKDKKVFLDLKLHDIPNTVSRAVASASELGVDLLTVHAAGGPAMLDAARRAADDGPTLLGVTVLTSMTPDEIAAAWGREIRSVREEVERLVTLAVDAGLPGVVASALEASWIRGLVGEDRLIVTPGIRPADVDPDDQVRVATPTGAIGAGADYLVVGRPITRSDDPGAAFAAIRAEVEAALPDPETPVD